MRLGVRLFVLGIFLLLGLSFLAPAVVLVAEFANADWLTLATFYSHLFIFFPTFGIATLCAFYLPACVFTDMYMSWVKFGRRRFAFGFAVVAGLSWLVAEQLAASPERSMFEVAPAMLKADRGEPAGCAGAMSCQRMPVLEAANAVRAVSQQRMGLADLARSCQADPLLEGPPPAEQRRRFCFASTPLAASARLVADAECCTAQHAFVSAINAMHAPVAQRSLTGVVHRMVLPGKIFFMLILLVISILLAWRRHQIERHYKAFLPGIERGVLIGAGAMIVYPIMSHAFLQSAALLYGSAGDTGYRATAPYFTFAFGAWAMLLLLFFFRRRDKELQALGRIGGIVGGGVAVVKYNVIIDVFVRIFGSGASTLTLSLLAVAATFAIVALFVQTTSELAVPEANGGEPGGEKAQV